LGERSKVRGTADEKQSDEEITGVGCTPPWPPLVKMEEDTKAKVENF